MRNPAEMALREVPVPFFNRLLAQRGRSMNLTAARTSFQDADAERSSRQMGDDGI